MLLRGVLTILFRSSTALHRLSAVENNRIAAYCKETGKTMGVGWKPADNIYYPINAAAIVANKNYTAAGRGNTNYKDKYGLSSVTITGVINSYDD